VPFEDVLAAARRAGVTIFTIVPEGGLAAAAFPDTEWRRVGAEFNLRALATETGGRAFTRTKSEDLSKTYSQIAEELSQQYWLAYVPKLASSGFKRVSVHVVTRPELRARTRSGYYATVSRADASAVQQTHP
jgi:VWFA-related protein